MARGKKTGGRKKGSLNKATTSALALRDYAAQHGLTPLDIMLDNMRHFHVAATTAEKVLQSLSGDQISGMEPKEQFRFLLAEVKKVAGLRQMAQECASDCAPYLHHRLASVEHTGKDGGPIETSSDPRNLARAILAILREAETEE